MIPYPDHEIKGWGTSTDGGFTIHPQEGGLVEQKGRGGVLRFRPIRFPVKAESRPGDRLSRLPGWPGGSLSWGVQTR